MLKVLLTKEMEKNKLSSRQVAKEVGVSHTTIIRALNGDDVDLPTLMKLSEWLGVQPATLLNSMTHSIVSQSLAEKIAILLQKNPRLEEEFRLAIKYALDEKIDLAVIEDIAAYAAYRIKLGIKK